MSRVYIATGAQLLIVVSMGEQDEPDVNRNRCLKGLTRRDPPQLNFYTP